MNRLKKIASDIRKYLDLLRKRNPKIFDKISKFIQFIIPFLGAFAPALVTNIWCIMIGEAVIFSSVLLFQWAILTNRRIREVDEALEDHIKEIDELKDKYNEDEAILEELYLNDNNKLVAQKIKEIDCLKHQIRDIAGFSYVVSDQVKKLSTEFEYSQDAVVTNHITLFLQKCLNNIEELLGTYYQVEIRASIKLTASANVLKTYVRRKNNIESRGGVFRTKELNEKNIPVKSNYAYNAIVKKKMKFFSEADLHNMHNKVKESDIFFCEYGDNWSDIFISTVVMPIRIPIYTAEFEDHNILGIICIDCNEIIPEWSDRTFPDKIGYHIIADLADSLAMLFKLFKNEGYSI